METNNQIKNIKQVSKAAQTIVKICKVICGVLAGITFISGCIFIGLQDQVNTMVQTAVDKGYFAYDSMTETISMSTFRSIARNGNLADGVGGYLIVASVLLILLTIILHFLGKIFKEFKEGYSPFQPEIIKNLKVIFVMITILGLNSSIVIGAVTGISLWCVTLIFEYGCDLQRQSDETL